MYNGIEVDMLSLGNADLLAGFASVALFYRYLKFFHQYSYELFLRYAEMPHP
jgi:hypothetical protein